MNTVTGLLSGGGRLPCFRSLKCHSAVKRRAGGREGKECLVARLHFPGPLPHFRQALVPPLSAVATEGPLTVLQLPASLVWGLFPSVTRKRRHVQFSEAGCKRLGLALGLQQLRNSPPSSASRPGASRPTEQPHVPRVSLTRTPFQPKRIPAVLPERARKSSPSAVAFAHTYCSL